MLYLISEEKLNILYNRIWDHYFTHHSSWDKRFKKVGLLRYLFQERGRLAIWNRNKKLLILHLFSLERAKDFKKRLDSIYLQCLEPLIRYLRQIMKESWKWKELSIYSYNLIVLLYDFSEKFTVFHRLKEFNSQAFELLELAYFRLISKENYVTTLCLTIETLFRNHRLKSALEPERDYEIIELLSNYLRPEGRAVTLFDYFLANNMVEKRGYIELHQIMAARNAPPVQTNFYRCDKDIFNSIMSYLQMLVEKIDRLEREYSLTCWIDAICKKESEEFSKQLKEFYNSIEADEGSYFLWAVTLLKKIGAELELFISEHWGIMNDKEEIIELKMINDPWLMECYERFNELLGRVISRYKAIVVPLISVSEVLEGGEQFNSIMEDKNLNLLYELINESLTALKALGFKLKEVLEDNLDRDSINYFFLNFMIVNPENWRGEQAAAAFFYYIEVIFRTCFSLREQELVNSLEGMERQERQLKSYYEAKERLFDSNGFIEELLNRGVEQSFEQSSG